MPSGRAILTFALLWLAGVSLRLSMLSVPPLLPMIQSSLGLSGTEIGILTGLPTVMFAIVALPAAVLIVRIGALPTLVWGLVIGAIAAALRGAYPSVLVLFAATAAMGAGIAIMHPALPAVVRQWTPGQIGFATALYTNGLIVGEILPVAFTLPILPAVGGSWQWALAVWSAAMLAIAVLLIALAPRGSEPDSPRAPVQMRNWWPDWHKPLVWQLGLVLASTNALYFCSNAFLPGYLTSVGQADLIAPALTALNLGQLPASIPLLLLANRLAGRVAPFILLGAVGLVAVAGIVLTAGPWTVFWSALVGFSCAAALTLGFALPALLCRGEDVARTSAGMFTISYSLSMLTSVLCGAAWDLTGVAAAAFLPIAISVLPLFVVTPTIRFARIREETR